MTAQVQVERDPRGWVTCWLDNADRRNALTDGMLAELTRVMREARVEEGVRAVIVRGRHGTFCSGRDLRELDAGTQGPGEDLSGRITPVRHLAQAVRGCPLPTIAVVEGKAAGLGVALATWCDLLLADAAASFSIPEARAGVAPSFTAVSLVRTIGRAAALDLCLTGRAAQADEALRWGLVQRVAAAGQLEHELAALQQSLGAGGPLALGACKALIARTAGATFDEALDQASLAAVDSMRSAEAAEGMQAFRERRPPRWVAQPEVQIRGSGRQDV